MSRILDIFLLIGKWQTKTNDLRRSIHEFYHRIEEVASLANPAASLLERDASHRLASISDSDPISSAERIEKHLDSIIRQANELIKRALPGG